MVAILGVALASVGTVWHTASMREREADLLFVGDQFRKAIISYRDSSPGAKEYPRRLEDLLEDRRSPKARRHLRKIFRDPLTDGRPWGLVRVGDRIVGVYSQGTGAPFRRTGFGDPYAIFIMARSYRDWIFSADDRSTIVAATAVRPPSGAPGTTSDASAASVQETPVETPPPPRCDTVFNEAISNCAKSGVKADELIACRKGAYAALNACSAGG